eukprot:TRINITY_DN5796_c0_g4_i5.p1 TRINITY_DN5796_c0_g4~~TRINITY_DN5796_c0_g4_i5.p1  ORF type:complete len:348 (+),score=60.42 TRINITY_DN5796_c0_g4_i5:37-1044(+)
MCIRDREDGQVEMVAKHSHAEPNANGVVVVGDVTPKHLIQGDVMPHEFSEEDAAGVDRGLDQAQQHNQPDPSTQLATPMQTGQQPMASFNPTPGSLSDIVLVVKAYDHECHLFVGGREQIEKLARAAGARVMKNLSKSVTHVLAPKVQLNDPVYQTAYTGMTMVDEEWLWNAVQSRAPSQPDTSIVGSGVQGHQAGIGAMVPGGVGHQMSSDGAYVAWCPICRKGFSTSQGMGGHYGRCKASYLAEQANAGGIGPPVPDLNPGAAKPHVCEHGWLAAECSECKIGQDEYQLQSINVSLQPKKEPAAAESQELASLFTDDFCVTLSNLLNVPAAVQ